MTTFHENSRKLHFWPNMNFSGKLIKPTSVSFFLDFYRCAKFQEKLMNRFREKLVPDVRTNGWRNGRA